MKKTNAFFAALLLTTVVSAQNTVAEARAMGEGANITITAVVTNGDEFGGVRYMQDETAGMVAFGSKTNGLEFGDSIVISGTLKNYRGLLEIDPISSVTLIGKAISEPQPKLVDADEIGENTEGQLIRVNDATFSSGGTSFTSTTFDFSANGKSSVAYINKDTDLIGELVPIGKVDIIGLSGQFDFNNGTEGAQLLPRSLDDIIEKSSVSIVSPLTQSNINTTTFDLNFLSNKDAEGLIFYSTDQFASTAAMTEVKGSTVSSHIITLNGLSPGTIYFAKAAVVFGTDTLFTPMDAFATKSLSSGKITAVFNNSVNTDVANSPDNHAVYSTAVLDTVIAYIERAQNTIDLALYNTGLSRLVTAVNSAYNRGVEIRYVAEGKTGNTAIGNLNSNIGFITRKNSSGSGMHNKFFVIDRDDTDNCYVIAGSTNMTSANVSSDPNNMIIIQDQSLARAYTIEFEEMFGSSGLQPNSNVSKFGADKVRNTPTEFILGDDNTRVELFFSPGGGTTSGIIDALETIDNNAHFALLVLTRDDIGDALIEAASKFGVTIDGIIDQVNSSGSEYDRLVSNFITIKAHTGTGFTDQLHHKYCIIDVDTDKDPMILTGSHNWSSSAENTNDENMLIVHDEDITNQYYQEYSARFAEFLVGVFENLAPENVFKVYPNPTYNKVVEIPNNAKDVMIFNALGKTSAFKLNGTTLSFDTNGVYIIKATIDGHASYSRVIVSN
jgi:phosphatidylserine/phosphatidylglycerophosphate/cardiolipin synthase-like enzyme